MKSLVKLLALFALIIVVIATVRSLGKPAEGALTVGSCDYLSVSPNSGVAPLSTTLTISAHTTDGSLIHRYVFNFGDGTPPITLTTNVTTHTYAQIGNPTASASVIDQYSNISTSPSCQKTVTVKTNIVCDALTAQARSHGGAPVTIDFQLAGHTSGGGSIATYRFDFGDGVIANLSSPQSTTSHTYSTPGTYVAQGAVVDPQGNASLASAGCTLAINIPPPGTVCLNWSTGVNKLCQINTTRTTPASQDPDINIVLREFIQVPGTLKVVNFIHDTAPSPQLCNLFPANSISVGGKNYSTAFTSLYGVGIPGGITATGKIESDPPHMAGFEVTPGEKLFLPPYTNTGDPVDVKYNAVLLFADNNQMTIKYSRSDNMASGYTLNIIGITPESGLLSNYQDNNRWYLPGIEPNQLLGTTKGKEVWVSIRVGDQFLDPRWQNDWWKTCADSVAPDTNIKTVAEPPGLTTTPATAISTTGPDATGLGVEAKPPSIPPLGALQDCPSQIPEKGNTVNENACVPTNSPGQKCISECSEPIKITENLQMFADNGCLRNGDCLANIRMQGDKISIPFAKYLGDYFAGVLDAEHPDKLQSILREGATDPSARMNQIFQAAGVARKLLPQDIQDRLKKQFVDYVKSKKVANPDGTYPNTRYLGHTADGKLDGTELMVYDKKVTDIEPPPNVNPHSTYSSRETWSAVWGKYWLAIPLFTNDDSQGEVELVSPTLFSTQELGNNPKYPQNNLGPFYISVPEVARLASATGVLQKAFIPQSAITNRYLAINTDPAKNLPTYGKPINVNDPVNLTSTLAEKIKACVQTNWSQYYTPSEMDRAVTCNIIATGSGTLSTPICIVGPDGQLRCYRQRPGTAPPQVALTEDTTDWVQVRTVVPNLFEIAEQTISPGPGLLRIFKAQNTNILGTMSGPNPDLSVPSQDMFEKNYAPVPASSAGKVQYSVSDRDVSITPKPEGWQLFFYRLGGVWNAQQFILDLLNPTKPNTTH